MKLPLIPMLALAVLSTGCVGPPTKESDTLSGITQLTTGFSRAGPAAFSPDMRWLAFQAVPPNESQFQIYVAQVRYKDDEIVGLGTPMRVTPPGTRNASVAFADDGRTLLFASSSGSESSGGDLAPIVDGKTLGWSFPRGVEIFRVESWQSLIAMPEPGKPFDFTQGTKLTKFGAYSAEMSVDPKLGRIAFASSRGQGDDVDLYLMRPDGSRAVRITHAHGYDGGPAISPDGKRVLFRADRDSSGRLQLFKLDLVYDKSNPPEVVGTTRERQLTKNTHVNIAPVWHPAGRWVMYANNEQGNDNFELRLMRRSGAQDCRITFTKGFDGFPTFSPDGSRLLWSSKRTADGTTQLFVARFKVPDYVKVAPSDEKDD
jgi:Tol biopolymer transport system component